MKKVIISGFGAFHTHKENPSEKLAAQMVHLSGKGVNYHSTILPVVFSEIPSQVNKLLEQLDDVAAILFCGLAASRQIVTPEKIALNWLYCPGRPDNEGKIFDKGEPLEKEGQLALMSTFPVEELSSFLKKRNMESEVSFSAGTYVCNQTYYYGLKKAGNIPCTFLHLPQDVDVSELAKNLDDFLRASLLS